MTSPKTVRLTVEQVDELTGLVDRFRRMESIVGGRLLTLLGRDPDDIKVPPIEFFGFPLIDSRGDEWYVVYDISDFTVSLLTDEEYEKRFFDYAERETEDDHDPKWDDPDDAD